MKTPSNALLIGNGELPSAALLRRLAQTADFVLAADGGADKAAKAGLTPDLVIGDLDSLAKQAWPKERTLHIPRQDNTDLEKALDWLQDNACRSVCIAGGVGGRWDFSLGNFFSVYPYLNKMEIVFSGDGWRIWPLTQSAQKTVRPGARVSVIPVTPCRNVTLKGLEYPLENAALTLGGTGRTLSNRAAADRMEITFDGGYLLLYAED